ncbi:11558_t:CDS:2, partial [Racocetra fulgida]
MSIKNVDESDGLTEQKMEIGGDISVMISKSVSNDENKASNEDPKPAAQNCDISLIEIFWENIGSSDSNQAELEKENAEENDIESNEVIGEVDDRGLDDLEAEVDWLLSDMRNGDSESADVWYGNGIYDVVDKEISLIDFDESDQMDEREPESMFDVFIKNNLIDFGCVAEKSVMNDNVEEMIDENRGINVVVNTNSSKMYQTNNEKFESLPEPSSEVTLYVKFTEAKFKTDVVLGREEIVEDLLKVLRDNDSDEFDCGDLDNGIIGWYQEPATNSDSNVQLDIGNDDRIMGSVFDRVKRSLVKSNCNSRFGDVDNVFGK